ncbi:MAG: FAD-dependent oxidoreductase [Acidobacteria bacterium]|nr:FAD-dependent oxidoreductase [Acidobacteriota bacterium]
MASFLYAGTTLALRVHLIAVWRGVDNAYIGTVSRSGVAVIGGGIVGLTSAKAAIDAGLEVTLFDPRPGLGASFAAAGMISPGSEFLGGFAHEYELSAQSAALWPEFALSLGVPLHRASTEVVGWTSGDRADVERYCATAKTFNVTTERVPRSGSSFDLSPRVSDIWRFHDEMFVDVSVLLERLIEFVSSRGVIVSERVVDVTDSEHSVAVTTSTGVRHFDRCLIATGSEKVPHGASIAPIVRSVRGVTLRALGNARTPGMIRAFVDGRQIYAVRHPDGMVVVGAISDETNSPRVLIRDMKELTETVTAVIPGLGDAEFREARSGLRPTTSDARSFFHTNSKRLAVTSGYFRHGILLAPIALRRAEAFWRD